MSDWNRSGQPRVNLLLLVAEKARRRREAAAMTQMQDWISAGRIAYWDNHPGARPASAPRRDDD